MFTVQAYVHVVPSTDGGRKGKLNNETCGTCRPEHPCYDHCLCRDSQEHATVMRLNERTETEGHQIDSNCREKCARGITACGHFEAGPDHFCYCKKCCGHDNLGWIGFSGKMYCHDCHLIVDEKFHHRLCDGRRCETLNCWSDRVYPTNQDWGPGNNE